MLKEMAALIFGKTSGILQYVVQQVITVVLEETASSIFRGEEFFWVMTLVWKVATLKIEAAVPQTCKLPTSLHRAINSKDHAVKCSLL